MSMLSGWQMLSQMPDAYRQVPNNAETTTGAEMAKVTLSQWLGRLGMGHFNPVSFGVGMSGKKVVDIVVSNRIHILDIIFVQSDSRTTIVRLPTMRCKYNYT